MTTKFPISRIIYIYIYIAIWITHTICFSTPILICYTVKFICHFYCIKFPISITLNISSSNSSRCSTHELPTLKSTKVLSHNSHPKFIAPSTRLKFMHCFKRLLQFHSLPRNLHFVYLCAGFVCITRAPPNSPYSLLRYCVWAPLFSVSMFFSLFSCVLFFHVCIPFKLFSSVLLLFFVCLLFLSALISKEWSVRENCICYLYFC